METAREFVDLVKEAKAYTSTFTLWPRKWAECVLGTACEWREFCFEQAHIDEVPNESGVYAFVVKPGISNGPDASYLMYIGQTTRSLRQRFREYISEAQKTTGRPKIVVLLNQYHGFLHFLCAPLPGVTGLDGIENALLAAYMPPANDQLPAEIRRVANAFGRRS